MFFSKFAMRLMVRAIAYEHKPHHKIASTSAMTLLWGLSFYRVAVTGGEVPPSPFSDVFDDCLWHSRWHNRGFKP